MAEFDVIKGLTNIYNRINAVCLKNGLDFKPRLVAVSKTKSKDLIMAAYEHGHRDFGENYIQELFDKSNDLELQQKCKDIRWHFIGNLQRNKVNKIVGVPGLDMIETVDSEKLATALNTAWAKIQKQEPLKIMVQVNTSREENKGGCPPEQSCTLVQHILDKCPSLKFVGIMTIGQYGYDASKGPNPDFLELIKCRDEVSNKFSINEKGIEVSMGMSDDFEHAIELGSTSVRVGTLIFGARSNKIPEEVSLESQN